MPKLDLLIEAWDDAIWEFTLAFEGLSDEELWKRADPKLLSVGELGGHVTHWEAVMWGQETDATDIKGPLVDKRFSYYTSNVKAPVKMDMGVEEMLKELKRVHEEAKAAVVAIDPDKDAPTPYNAKVTWGQYLKYRSFHVAYHCGQAYSVRHLLGHTTTDN